MTGVQTCALPICWPTGQKNIPLNWKWWANARIENAESVDSIESLKGLLILEDIFCSINIQSQMGQSPETNAFKKCCILLSFTRGNLSPSGENQTRSYFFLLQYKPCRAIDVNGWFRAVVYFLEGININRKVKMQVPFFPLGNKYLAVRFCCFPDYQMTIEWLLWHWAKI